MKRLFLSISKGEELRFLGHLDMLRTMERAVIRSGIPIAFSEGFNPHMKIAFDAALGVGVTADPLYLEMKLEKDFLPEKVSALLTPQLLKGIMLHEIKEVGLDSGKLVTFLNEDVYEMEGPVDRKKDILQTEKNIAEFNALDSFIYERVTPKKVRQMDVKPMIIQPMRVKIQGNRVYLIFLLPVLSQGVYNLKIYGKCWQNFLICHGYRMPLFAQEPERIIMTAFGELHLFLKVYFFRI